MVSDAVIFIAGLGCGLLLLWAVFALVQRPHMLAVPNERSSHTRPTPTMGGLAFGLIVIGFLLYLTSVELRLAASLATALGSVVAIGLWDDLRGLSPALRLCVHVLAAAFVCWGLDLQASWWLNAMVVVGLVWLVNLYNFMDGIDGYAAAQALVFCLGLLLVGEGMPVWTEQLVWLFSGAMLAFLAFNWPPAKIFMGDVGSGFIGLLIGAIVVYLVQLEVISIVSSLILLAGFWVDATYTLIVRLGSGQNISQAHRQHAYQLCAIRIGHARMTIALVLYAGLWLLPLAYVPRLIPESLLLYGWSFELALLAAAVAPVVALGVWSGAGRRPG